MEGRFWGALAAAFRRDNWDSRRLIKMHTLTINETIKLKLLGIWVRSAKTCHINYSTAVAAKCEHQINYAEQASANLAIIVVF